jgi:anti-sigma B factor antagonist
VAIPEFRTEVVARNGAAIIVVEGEVDAHTAPILAARLDEATAATTGTVIVDIGAMSFIDSRGLSALAQAVRQLGPRPLVLRSPSSTTRKLLDICGLASLVRVED